MATPTQRFFSSYKKVWKNNKPKLNLLYTKKRVKLWKRRHLKRIYAPQKKGVVLRLRVCTPRKPNSARRPVTKLKLSTKKLALAHIPGSPHNLRKFSKVLIDGNRCRDLPVVNYSSIRGKFDFEGLQHKKRRRSIYGVKKDSSLKTHIRRKFRKLVDS